MGNKVIISGYSFRMPGISNLKNLVSALKDDGFTAPYKEIPVSDNCTILAAILDLDGSSDHYPRRSTLKVLRPDVVAALVCSGELYDRAGLSEKDMLEVPLIISNGSSFDLSMDQVAEVTEAFLPQTKGEEWANRYQRVNMIWPPLFVLKALANSAASFVAQKIGARGDNTTFGISSHSTYYALLEGVKKIRNQESEMALVGANNGIGIYSPFIYRNYSGEKILWKESEGAGFLLLETMESCQRHGRHPLAEIVEIDSTRDIPDIFPGKEEFKPYQNFNENLADTCIFSGGLSEGDFKLEEEVCKAKWADVYSWKPKLGILGNNGIIMNIITSLVLISQKQIREADCLNRDPFGRESIIKIRSA